MTERTCCLCGGTIEQYDIVEVVNGKPAHRDCYLDDQES